jgi:micrococcal nuclease
MQTTKTLLKITLLGVVLIASAYGFVDKEAYVIAVTDGDTIKVKQGDELIKIRLADIDCPEKAQPFGKKAKQFTASLVFNKSVTLHIKSTDRYRRKIATVRLADGRVLNEELVKQGLAWHYRQYSNDMKYAQLEDIARSEKLNLWSAPNPTPPWKWRKQ